MVKERRGDTLWTIPHFKVVRIQYPDSFNANIGLNLESELNNLNPGLHPGLRLVFAIPSNVISKARMHKRVKPGLKLNLV